MSRKLLVTSHAIERYRERGNANGTNAELRDEIIGLIGGAKPRLGRAAKKRSRNTTIVPVGFGYFIASHGKVVSFVTELRDRANA